MVKSIILFEHIIYHLVYWSMHSGADIEELTCILYLIIMVHAQLGNNNMQKVHDCIKLGCCVKLANSFMVLCVYRYGFSGPLSSGCLHTQANEA